MLDYFKNYIIENFYDVNSNIRSKKFNMKIHEPFLEEVQNKFSYFENFPISAKLKCIVLDLLEQKKCKCCGELIKYSSNYFEKEYCSKKCSAKVSNSSESQKEKCKTTLMNKYGVDNIFKNKDTIKIIQEKRNSKKQEINEKVRNTIKTKYSENKFVMSKKYLKDDIQDIDLKEFNNNGKFNIKECIKATGYAYSSINQFKIKFGILSKNITDKINKSEKEISDNFGFICNDRILIKPLEIDLISYTDKLCIEYNGLMFHSYGISQYSMFNNINKIDKNRHLTKTEKCEEKGYSLLHIFENEFLDKNKKEIWFSIIRNRLKLNNKIYARKCVLKEISSDESNLFLEQNHLQGKCNASIRIGLYYNDELVSLMTFGKSRYNKNFQYELIRFCSKINNNVIGGANKLLKYFETTYKPKSIISYANRRFSQGKIYETLGFEFVKNTEPNFFYFRPGEYKLLSRVTFQKHKLKDKLQVFDSEKTGLENMLSNGYRVIYDCGNKLYIKEYSE